MDQADALILLASLASCWLSLCLQAAAYPNAAAALHDFLLSGGGSCQRRPALASRPWHAGMLPSQGRHYYIAL